MKINSAYVVALKQAIRELGHDPAPFIRNAPALDEIGFYKLCNTAAAEIDDPTFALRYGSALHLGTHGILGNALMSCRTLRHAAEFLIQHNPMAIMDGQMQFGFDHENAILSMTNGVELPAAPHFLPEVFIMAVVNAISEMVGTELEGCHVEFAFQPTMPPDVYERFIGLPVRFGKDGNRFIGPRDAANLPLAAAHNEVAEIFVRQCSMLLVEKNSAGNHTTQVRRILLNSKRKISCEHAVAQQLNMSGRTLRRRLSDEETSFREIYDELRKEMATAYLTETRISIAEIGSLLGFDDVANFRRAFRRWNDCSPQQFRATQGTDAFLEVGDIERRFQETLGAMQ